VPRRKKYDQTVQVAMTSEMYANLLRVAGQRRKVPGQIRAYIRHGLDEQGEIVGSRRYFTGRFRDAVRLQRLEYRWFLTVLLALVAEGFSYIILGVYPDMPDEDRVKFSGPALFRTAVAQAADQGHRIQQQFDDLILDKSLPDD
jgi:hypothetical protein